MTPTTISHRFFAITIIILWTSIWVSASSHAARHEGPDPLAHWIFNSRTVTDDKVRARLGPDGMIAGEAMVAGNDGGLLLAGPEACITISDDINLVKEYLPTRDFTVSARVSINTRRQWGGIVGVLQDNRNAEKGWVLGYDTSRFYIGLATTGADDGDGKMTYLRGDTEYETGRYYHVVAVYDGKRLQLFVNGKLDAESEVQSGDVLYPESAPLVLGAYQDADEFFPHHGRIHDVAIYDIAAKPKWVTTEFEHQQRLTELSNLDSAAENFEVAVAPFLQFANQTSITVGWQTTKPSRSLVRYGETAEVRKSKTGSADRAIHHVTLDRLKPNTQYFYQIESVDSAGKKLVGKVLTFQTACDKDTPFAFAIISDTQSNPKVAAKVAEMAWQQRPGFLIHPGDLVGTGSNDLHWTEQFFPAMSPLIGRVPIYPVLGNHEVNARNYYDYFQLPDPEYYYDFVYGNAHFFMLDTNKNVGPQSEQYKWLEKALAGSTAKWKFVVHHHPVYSSDENDYGDLWKTNKSTRGDQRVRVLTRLYDKYKVDIVWNGHIHSYERTWPVADGAATSFDKGTVYMVTGGGGGGLETPGPYRPFFQNNVKRGHHYCMAHVNDGVLEFKAFDLEGRLFDYMKLEKE